MAKQLSAKLTYSNVMSTIAVFLALGGGGFAVAAALKKDSVKSKQVKDESLVSKDLKDGKGVGASDLIPDEDWRLVGGTGEPPLSNGGENDCLWVNLTLPPPTEPTEAFGPASFYKDKSGIVHLDGGVSAVDGPQGDNTCDDLEDRIIFRLPEGYRPLNIEGRDQITFPEDGSSVVIIGRNALASGSESVPPGSVALSGGALATGYQVLLDGISFRADTGEDLSAKAPEGAAAEVPLLEDLSR